MSRAIWTVVFLLLFAGNHRPRIWPHIHRLGRPEGGAMNRRDFLTRTLYLGLALGMPGGAVASNTATFSWEGKIVHAGFLMSRDIGYAIPMKWISRDKLIEMYPTE
jgi:hypothetical protein